ncbi:MAG: SDR family NAD(P)-dependent oxidoreductase [Desulfamplus sp.]|nr:SDR family NAD(P)-dependent oxidoreductase [Desulfamplus sp.]
MAGLVIITDSSHSKDFVKKSFLLAKQNGKYLIDSAAKAKISGNSAFFVSLSSLNGAFGFEDGKVDNPLQGAVAGLLKTAALEWSQVLCRAIDIEPISIDDFDFSISSISQSLIYLMLTKRAIGNFVLSDYVEIGIKDNCIIIPQLKESPIPLFSSFETLNNRLNSDDVIVITGGARGVTAECAVELASTFSPKIILIGRSPLLREPEPEWLHGLVSEVDIKKAILLNIFKSKSAPTPSELQAIYKKISSNREISQNLKRIEAAGSFVKYYSVDIRDFEELNKALKDAKQNFGKITGVVHGAGVLEDKLIVDKTLFQFDAVFDTKVVGMENLLKATAKEKLKFVLFFSSVAARYGNVGQVDYAMANEVLNKTAQHLANSKKSSKEIDIDRCRFISINWGAWEGGMVSLSLKNAFKKRGIDLIDLNLGAKSFVQEICNSISKDSSSDVVDFQDVEVVIGASLLSTPSLFDRDKIVEFAIGSPSKAFGEKYKDFDEKREIARLPGPPYFFMDRVIKADAKPWEMVCGGWIEAQFDMPSNGWYFRAAHTDYLPFCILLEIALQPCGWLAAYVGSALKSKERLFFRNLGGEAQIFEPVTRESGTLTMRSKMTSVSHAGGLIIQNFLMEVLKDGQYIYKGSTNFGFFTAQALKNQAGIKSSHLHDTQSEQSNSSDKFYLKDHHPLTPDDMIEDTDTAINYGMAAKAIRMVDTIDKISFDGGKYQKGFIKGTKLVDPDEWFFKAHFYQDPVCPGSLGVESFLQLIKFYSLKLWKYDPLLYELVLSPHTHKWIYRGQIIPSCSKIEIMAHIKDKDNNCQKITADGLLYVDGLCIYQMEDFSMELVKKKKS